MADFELYTKREIGIPYSPAKWISDEPEYHKVTRVKMICGGGVGGSVWYEYIDRDEWSVDEDKGCKMLHAVRYNGKKIILNPRYIVCMEDFTLMTAWFCVSTEYFDPPYERCVRYLVPDGHKVFLGTKCR